MKYEETPVSTKPSKVAVHKAISKELDSYNTGVLLWHIVRRHKFGLVTTWAVLVTISWIVPAWPHIIIGLFSSL